MSDPTIVARLTSAGIPVRVVNGEVCVPTGMGKRARQVLKSKASPDPLTEALHQAGATSDGTSCDTATASFALDVGTVLFADPGAWWRAHVRQAVEDTRN